MVSGEQEFVRSPLSDPRDTMRNVPSQNRSLDRIDAILDAAASLVDAGGMESVNVTAVAFTSGSSVGAVYRYFPNMNALLYSLAQRNLQRLLLQVEEGSRTTSAEPWSSLDHTFDAYINMYRSEPGFRHLRFGEAISDRLIGHAESTNKAIARQFAGMIAETHGVEITDHMLFHLEVAATTFMALADQAFRDNPEGDPAILSYAKLLVKNQMLQEIPIHSRAPEIRTSPPS